jgi:hypothetical protein
MVGKGPHHSPQRATSYGGRIAPGIYKVGTKGDFTAYAGDPKELGHRDDCKSTTGCRSDHLQRDESVSARWLGQQPNQGGRTLKLLHH